MAIEMTVDDSGEVQLRHFATVFPGVLPAVGP